MTLYHYTTKENYDSIMKTQQFSPSSPWTSQDMTYGEGWYFTDLAPSKCDIAIALQCWQTEDAINKVQFYLKFDIENSFAKYCRENVYMIKTGLWDTAKIKYIEGNQIPNCNSRPCKNCNQGKNIIQRFFDLFRKK